MDVWMTSFNVVDFNDMSKFTQDEWDEMKSNFEEFDEEVIRKAKKEAAAIENDENAELRSERHTMFRDMRLKLAEMGDRLRRQEYTQDSQWSQQGRRQQQQSDPVPVVPPHRMMSYLPTPVHHHQMTGMNWHLQPSLQPPVTSSLPSSYHPPQFFHDNIPGGNYQFQNGHENGSRRSSW
mmetsp:Transcript_11760/g.14636  ORF Transcript_11760/g.14636 Transcript_11760/m.14636 type:complete len:179 (-) Transcript_11760:58-594(-)